MTRRIQGQLTEIVQFRASQGLLELLEEAAAQHLMTRSAFVRDLLREELIGRRAKAQGDRA